MLLALDERLRSIVIGKAPYEVIRDMFDEVYATVNDEYLVISRELFHYIVGNFRSISPIKLLADNNQITISEKYYNFLTKGASSIDQIEELFGETIVRRYLARQKCENQAKKLSNLSRGSNIHKANANLRRAQIISLVLAGYSKQEIEKVLGISRSTIDRALRGLDSLKLSNTIDQYRDIVFCDLDQQAYDMFLEADCSYAKFRKKLKSNKVLKEISLSKK